VGCYDAAAHPLIELEAQAVALHDNDGGESEHDDC
jgi:hypothetical protein